MKSDRRGTRAIKRFGLLVTVLVLVALGLLSYYSLLLMTDNIGTFRSTTDVVDLDGDADLDVILHTVRQESEFTAFSGMTLWFNRGDGRFVARRPEGPQENAGWSVASGDVDRDGDVDLLTFPGWYLRVILNLGVAQDGLALRAAALGDLEGDGDLDLFAAVIAPQQGRNTDPADRVLINDGSGAFTDSGQRLGETDSTAVALEDVDGDADLDALVAGRRQAVVWWNDGQALFTRSNQRFHYSKRHGVAIGEFNGDGWSDVFAGRYSQDFRVWLNQGDGTFRRAHRSSWS